MISVVVPIYNVAHYLSRTVDSLLAQSYGDIEIILIDDGSSDHSGEICDLYVAKDRRVRCLHTPNGGVSRARNLGIEMARGEYIAFVDSDDWVDSDYLSNFRHGEVCADLCIAGAIYDVEGCGSLVRRFEAANYRSPRDIVDGLFRQGLWGCGYPWGKLFRTALLQRHGVRFREELRKHEDHIFLFDYLAIAESVAVVSATSYHYRCLDVGGRKLSDVSNNYDELVHASELFEESISRMAQSQKMTPAEVATLIQRFVCGCRFEAMGALFAQPRYAHSRRILFRRELMFWRARNSAQPLAEGRFRSMVVGVMRRVEPKYIAFGMLSMLYFVRNHRPRNPRKEIFADLKMRGARV